MRLRKRLITNIHLKSKDIKRLANGYVVYKSANKHVHCLMPHQAVDKKQAEIAKLKERLKALENGSTKAYGVTKGYTKRNMEYWNNYKGNNPKMRSKPCSQNGTTKQ